MRLVTDAIETRTPLSISALRPTLGVWSVALAVLLSTLFADGVGPSGALKAFLLYAMAWATGWQIRRWSGLALLGSAGMPAWLGALGQRAFETVLGIAVVSLAAFVARGLGLPDWSALAPFGLLLVWSAWSLLSERRAGHREPAGTDLDSWLFLGLLAALLLLVTDTMVSVGPNLYFRDPNHPIYELSIARGSVEPGFIKPDLSYAGKTMVFHMLGPVWLSLMTDTLGIDALSATLRGLPMGQIALTSALMAFVAARFTGSARAALAATTCALLLGPFGLAVLSGKLIIAPFELLAFHASTAVSFPALLALLLVVASAPHADRRSRALAVVALLGGAVFYSKAPYLVPLAILYGIWSLVRVARHRDWSRFQVAAALGVGALPFVPLLKGAHGQNYWLAIPNAPWFGRIVDWLHAEDHIAGQLAAWLAAIPIGVVMGYGLPGLGLITGVWLLRSRADLASRDDDLPLVSWGAAAVGLLLGCVISEISESNQGHFFSGYAWSGWLAWVVVSQRLAPRWKAAAASGAAAVAATNYLLHGLPYAPLPQAASLSGNPWSARAKLAATRAVFGEEPIAHRVRLGLLRLAGSNRRPAVVAAFPGDLRDSLLAARGLPGKPLLLRSPLYQDLDWERRAGGATWDPNSAYFGSAVSGRRFFLEGHCYKGICVEPDYHERFADTVRFYWYAVGLTTESPRAARWRRWQEPFVPGQMHAVASLPLARALTLKGDPSSFSASRQTHDLFGRLAREAGSGRFLPDEGAGWSRSFLRRHGITAVVFEQGERPDAAFAARLPLRKVAESGSVALYEFRP